MADFPAEHWLHLRTSNPIESTFATVRLRTYRTKGPGSGRAGDGFQAGREGAAELETLNGKEKLKELLDGGQFVDGVRKAA